MYQQVYDEQQCTSLASPLALVEQYCIAVERLKVEVKSSSLATPLSTVRISVLFVSLCSNERYLVIPNMQ